MRMQFPRNWPMHPVPRSQSVPASCSTWSDARVVRYSTHTFTLLSFKEVSVVLGLVMKLACSTCWQRSAEVPSHMAIGSTSGSATLIQHLGGSRA